MGIFGRRTKVTTTAPSQLPGWPRVSSFSYTDIHKNTTVQACVNAIANPIAILPLNLYTRQADGSRNKATEHNLYKLLKLRPNTSESPTLFMGKLMRHILQRGNAYILKGIKGADIAALRLLDPEEMKRDVTQWPAIRYMYQRHEIPADQILHIPSLVTDEAGNGIAPVDLAKAAVTLGIQLDDYSLSSFGNGLNTKLLIDIAEMTKDAKNEEEASATARVVSNYVKANYAGADNAGKPLVTWAGMSVKELTHQSSNRDAELLESRRWQEIEICKVFGVAPWMVNGSYDVKYGGLESAMTVYLNFTLSPYLRHIEQSFAELLKPHERAANYFEFDFNVLLRPDEKSRGEFYNKLFMMGAISPAGICAKENLDPPTEAGNTRFVPAQLMPLTDDNMAAYMAKAKATAAGLLEPGATDPARAAGDDKL
jgi:HK97 family phage portal protein